jgi:DNA mismatch repair ATPase MutS
MKRFNDEFLLCTRYYEDKMKKILDEVIRIASENNMSFNLKFFLINSKFLVSHLDTIQYLNNLISEVDIFVSFSKISESSPIEYNNVELYFILLKLFVIVQKLIEDEDNA